MLLVLIPSLLGRAQAGGDRTSSDQAVKTIAPATLDVKTGQGTGILPLYVSADCSKPLPEIKRALVLLHDKLRNARGYYISGAAAVRNAGEAGEGTLLVAPQFLQQVDVDTFHLPPNVLRWAPERWMGGEDALNAEISSFDAIDMILYRLADRKVFPNLKNVVIAGHSGGGQAVQRYAVAGKAEGALTRYGIHVRYVVANPSSYLYFSSMRPVLSSKDKFEFAPPGKSCNGKYQTWKYGPLEPPPYVDAASLQSGEGGDINDPGPPSAYETAYVRRDVVYLLGTEDTDPEHPALDKTCSAEDQGPYRFYRGKAYFAYLEARHPELKQQAATQQLWFVQGTDHDGDKMFHSPCGIAALFGAESCAGRVLDPAP